MAGEQSEDSMFHDGRSSTELREPQPTAGFEPATHRLLVEVTALYTTGQISFTTHR